MKELLFKILNYFWEEDFKEWKKEQANKDEIVAKYFIKTFGNSDFDKNKMCKCNRPKSSCRCMDKAFGY